MVEKVKKNNTGARLEGIIARVKLTGFASTKSLTTEFKVTPQTIRRDINELASQGHLRKVHGGAGLPEDFNKNTDYRIRKEENKTIKQTIAERTARLIANGTSLFLNIGTTTEAVGEALLDHKDLHVVTNNVHVASCLSQNPTFQILCAGGQIRNFDGGVVSPDTVQFMNQFRLDVGVIGISGIDEDGALLDYDQSEVKVTQIIIRNCKKVILVADPTKFGRRAMNKVGDISDIDTLVTQGRVPAIYQNMCEKYGVEIVNSDATRCAA